jgi:uncharacterized membrane protein/cytochrome c553
VTLDRGGAPPRFWVLSVLLLWPATRARAQDASADEALVTERGCTACHSLDGTPRVGPSFASRAGAAATVTSADGASHEVTFDEAYVLRSILEPDAELAAGHTPGTMPRLAHDEADASALAHAVDALASRPPPAPPTERSPFLLLLAVLAFVLGHFALSSTAVRTPLIARLGENGFGGAYSLLVLAAFVWMVAEWVFAPYVELFRPPAWTRWVPNVVMPISYTLLIAGYTIKSPTIAGMASASAAGPSGWTRITRHPALWGFALWGLSHLPANGDLRSLLLMGGIAALALGGMVHIDARRRASGGEAWASFERQTSLVPFAAIARGGPWPTFADLGWWRFALGIGGWAVMLHLHQWLIGVSPLP